MTKDPVGGNPVSGIRVRLPSTVLHIYSLMRRTKNGIQRLLARAQRPMLVSALLTLSSLLVWRATRLHLRESMSRGDSRNMQPLSQNELKFCGQGLLNSYIKWHSAHRSQLARNSSLNVSILIYSCREDKLCGGLGDRLSGITSAFHIAIATKRLFLIDYSDPLPLNYTLRPNKVNWQLEDSVMKSLSRQAATSYQTIDAIDSTSPYQTFKEIFSAHEADTNVLELAINRYHIALALWNENRKASEPYFGALHQRAGCGFTRTMAAETFKAAFHALFTFSDTVQRRSREKMKMLNSQEIATPFIGIHARVGGGPWSDPLRHDVEQAHEFLQCAKKKRSAVQAIFKKFRNIEIPIIVFSDSEQFKTAIGRLDSDVKSFPTTLIHVDKVHVSESDVLIQGNVDSFSDVYLLSQAKCIVGSSSSFSGVASALQTSSACFSIFSECQNDRTDFFQQDEEHKLKEYGP